MALGAELVYDFGMKRHTLAKHRILRLYLEHWFPILNSRGDGLAYIDGFAGQGTYDGGEPGSPIIALQTANAYSGKSGFYAHFWFIESDPTHAESLRGEVSRIELRDGIRVEGILESKFEEGFPAIIGRLRDEFGMPPTFALVDPSGFSGVKMKTLATFLHMPRCELMFTLMDGFLTRFSALPEDARKKTLNDLFGTDEWEGAKDHSGSRKTKFLLDLYVKQLKAHGVRYIQTFEMCNKHDQTVYHLVFATNKNLGIEKMKEAMVKVDPGFTFRTSDALDHNQSYFFSYAGEEWYEQAAKLILRQFSGKTVTRRKIKWFVILETPYLYKEGILDVMTRHGQIVNESPRTGSGRKTGLDRTVTFEKSNPVQTRLFPHD